jgi:hypothetical protein
MNRSLGDEVAYFVKMIVERKPFVYNRFAGIVYAQNLVPSSLQIYLQVDQGLKIHGIDEFVRFTSIQKHNFIHTF